MTLAVSALAVAGLSACSASPTGGSNTSGAAANGGSEAFPTTVVNCGHEISLDSPAENESYS